VNLMHSALILLLGRGFTQHRPHPALAAVEAHEHLQQLVAVRPVALGARRA